MAKDKRVPPAAGAAGPKAFIKKVPGQPPPDGGWYKCRPAWSFSHFDTDGVFGWHAISRLDMMRVVRLLKDLETQTWNDILVVGAKKYHAIESNKLSVEAQARLTALGIDDLDAVVSLRLTGEERVHVARFEHFGHLLWWDPKHQVYPVEKRNT